MYKNEKVASYPVIDMVKFGVRLKMICDLKKVSANELKDFLNLGSIQAVYLWMAGKRLPSLDNLYALSKYLNVPVDVLLCDDSMLRFTNILQDDKLSGHGKRILMYWTGLQRETRNER